MSSNRPKAEQQVTHFQRFLHRVVGRPLRLGGFAPSTFKDSEGVMEAWRQARAECEEFDRVTRELNYGFTAEVLDAVDSFAAWQEALTGRKEIELQALGVSLEFDDRDAVIASHVDTGQQVSALDCYGYLRRTEIRQKYRDEALNAIATTPWLRAYLEDLRRLDSLKDEQERTRETLKLWRKHSGGSEDI
jgi:hypothetical protein